MSEPGNRRQPHRPGDLHRAGIVTIGGTLISNFGMWSYYDKTEAEQDITPEQATPVEP